MIQPLRAIHRRAFIGLAVVLPTILMVGIGARREAALPVPHGVDLPSSVSLVGKSGRLWQGHSIPTEFYRDSQNPQKVYVVLKGLGELTEPDLLLYWVGKEMSGEELRSGTLPTDAKLIGSVEAGPPLTLPEDAKAGGQLVLYSLGHRKVVDTASVEKLP